MGEPTAKDVVRAAIYAFSDQDRDGFADLHAGDVVVHGPTGDIHGVEAVTDEEFGIFDAFSDLTWTLDSVIAEESVVAVRLTATGTHDGNLGDLTPTGTRVSFASYGMFRVEDGQVAEVWVLPDRLGLRQQLRTTQNTTAR